MHGWLISPCYFFLISAFWMSSNFSAKSIDCFCNQKIKWMLFVKIPRRCKFRHERGHPVGAVLLEYRKPRRRWICPIFCLYLMGTPQGSLMLWADFGLYEFENYVTFPRQGTFKLFLKVLFTFYLFKQSFQHLAPSEFV